MAEDIVLLGRIARPLEKALGVDLGSEVNVFVEDAELRRFAEKWPDSYLAKLAEAKAILRRPLYLAYDKKSESLCLIKEYPVPQGFKKVALELVKIGHWRLHALYSLTPEKTVELCARYAFRPLG